MLYKFFIIPKCLFFSCLLLIISHKCFSQQYDAELINQQTVIEASEGKLIQTNFFEIRINNRSGDKYAEVSIPFTKMNKVSDIEASVSDFLGTEVKKLKKSDITERSESSSMTFFNDTYVKEFKLRNNTYPYTFKYSYRIDASQFMFITHWAPVIDYEIPTRLASLKITSPEGYKISYNAQLIDPPRIDSISGSVIYSWTASYKNPVQPEMYSPPGTRFIPTVEVVPVNFVYELDGSHESWKSYGSWNYKLLNGLDDLPLSEKFRIHYSTDSIKDEKEKIRVLFHYLQDATRYVNVSVKTGGLKPYPASYVAANKYGDCKALSNYLKSCLSEINIKSYYTKINAGEVIEPINPDFPSQQFNHVILFIPLKQDTLWVDCTSDLAFGYLGTFTQNRPALVLDFDGSALVNTPALTTNDVMETRRIQVKINTDKTAKAEFTNTFHGDKYETLSYIRTEISESQRSQYLRDNSIEPGFQLDTYSISAPERDNPEIIFKYSATSDQLMKEYGAESLLKIIPMFALDFEEPKKRKLPVQINFPINQIDSIEYSIPDNYKITTVPQNTILNSGYGEYHVDFRITDNTVMAIKHLIINSGSYPIKEYQKFYDFLLNISESENSFYIALTNK